MIVALSGRRIDARGAAVRRFPAAHEVLVRARVAAVLERYKPQAVVASGAAGADLIGLEEAGARGIRRRMLLPFVPARFRATSVADRAGDWGARFDRVCREVERAGDLVVHPAPRTDEAEDAAYLRVVRAILDEALALAAVELAATGQPASPASDVVAVAIWDGASRGAEDMTAAFIAAARARGIAVEHVLTS